MPLLYRWRRENYVEDITFLDRAAGLELAQNSTTFAEATPGERLWAFTRRHDGTYVLGAQLRVGRVEEAGSAAPYGRYRAFPQPGTTVLYDVQQGRDAEDLIRSLSIPADAAILGQSFQGGSAVRRLSGEDDARLEVFAAELPVLHDGAAGSPDQEDIRFWDGLLRNAEAALASGTVFGSPKQGRPYRVAAVEPERVVIQRVDTSGSEVLTRRRHREVMSEIRGAGGRVPRRSLFYTVAKEAMLVALHPALRWDATGDWVELVLDSAQARPLRLYEDYSRGDVHGLFAPDTPFYPQAGTWGLQGIVPVPDRPGDYVFFVTFGQHQGEHVFDEDTVSGRVYIREGNPEGYFDFDAIQYRVQLPQEIGEP